MKINESKLLKIISEEIAKEVADGSRYNGQVSPAEPVASHTPDMAAIQPIIARIDEMLQEQGHGNMSGAAWDESKDHELDLILSELNAQQLQDLHHMKCNITNGSDTSGAIPWPSQTNPCTAVSEKIGSMEQSIELTEASWPEDKTQSAMMGRAGELANNAMQQQISGDIPPWRKDASGQTQQYAAPGGDSVTDEDVVRSIYNLLKDNASSGYRKLAGRFMEMMKERGVVSIEAATDISQGQKLRAARMAGVPGDI